MPTTDESVRRWARLLTGFMPPEIANGFSKHFVLDPPQFLAAWQQQQAALAKQPPPPSTPSPQIQPLPAGATPHVSALQASPLFAHFYGPNAQLAMAELGKLIACQYWVDTDASGGVHGTGIQPQPTPAEVLGMCLPLSIIPPANIRYQELPNGVIAYSMNNTLQLMGPGLNHSTGQLSFVVSAGANLMLIREHAGRYFLTNGYHRAWLLKSKGVTSVPVVIVPAASQQEVVLGPDFIPATILFGARPPTIDDFFDNSLSMDVEVRSMLKAVRMTFETLLIPRLL